MASRFWTFAGRALITAALSGLMAEAAWAQAVHVTDDTNINLASPTQVNGTATTLLVRNVGSGGERHTFLRFNGATLPVGQVVTKATLRLFVTAVNDPGRIDVYSVAGPWTEETLTAAAAPARGALVGTIVVTAADTNRYVVLDVTSVVQAWLAGTLANGGLVLVPSTVDPVRVTLDSKESIDTSQPPELEVAMISPADITAVNVGLGLTGGGTTGDVTVALDTPFTDARYAASSHGHTVGQVSGAATLGANLFVGSQDVFGRVAANQSAVPSSVVGQHSAAAGQSVGVAGISNSTSGTGVEAAAPATSGSTKALQAYVNSTAGVAALLENRAGGDIIRGTSVDSALSFRVDGTGAVYAGSYRDLAGNPIASGTGDITAVAVATGLTGGGATADVTLGLDTAFTDGRYAGVAHGHTVAQVSGAATLGANTFTGNQSVTGVMNVSSQVNAASVRAISATSPSIRGETTATNSAVGVFGVSPATAGGAGVYGLATAVSGTGSVHGVYGETVGQVGAAVRGLARHQFGLGVDGFAEGTNGTGVLAQASANSGNTTGLFASVNSPTGTSAKFQSAGGDFLLGLQSGLTRFRIDAAGAVYASSYRDLAGNPIASGTGDITAVAAAAGLTGGGGSGDVSLALDTAFTDGRYAALAHGHTVSQVANAASLGANLFSGTQTIGSGDLNLGTGSVLKNGTSFLHTPGTNNLFAGVGAGNASTTGFGKNSAFGGSALTSLTDGADNTAVGYAAMASNGSGNSNTAVGVNALRFNTNGGGNTVSGHFAMQSNTSGDSNTAAGYFTMVNNTTGSQNTALGSSSLSANATGSGNTAVGLAALQNTTGSGNVAVGRQAGRDGTTGTNNIYLGAEVLGVAGESNTMYLGKQGIQTATYIAGIRGTTVTGGEVVMIDATGRLGSGAAVVGGDSVGSAQVIDESLTAVDLGPGSVAGSELAAGAVTADKVAFGYAGSAAPGGPALDVACVGCIAASEVGFSFASLGANTFTATQTLAGGNLDLGATSATSGSVFKGSERFMHGYGPGNAFLGERAGNVSMTGLGGNTGVGTESLFRVTTGRENAAVGFGSLASATTGSFNAAFGSNALVSNTIGGFNTAVGQAALVNTTSGGNNVALGYRAGFNATGSNNIYVGAFVQGLAGESNTMYLGSTQTKALIAGVRGTTTVNPDAIPVVIDSAGQLGTISSSRRFKEDIHDMADTSRRLLQLRPVTFRYTQPFGDGTKPVQYGLIAEEVADVFPELAVRNARGEVETVHYETLNVLLLNELQRVHREMTAQRERLLNLERMVDGLAAAHAANAAPPR